jgi:hypothetical protein
MLRNVADLYFGHGDRIVALALSRAARRSRPFY